MSDRRVALVTGANRGIGRETARQLAARGMDVLAGARAPDRFGPAEPGVAPVRLDVTDVATVSAVRDLIDREFGHLDVLVNNAGVFVGRTAAETTADDARPMFEANVLGVITMINELLPLLSRSTSARVVNVSSTTGSLGLTSAGADLPGDADRRLAYTSSKAALNMLTVQYARAFAGDPRLAHIKVNSATPGYTSTDMNDHRGTRTVAEGAGAIVAVATLPDDGPTGAFLGDDGPVPW